MLISPVGLVNTWYKRIKYLKVLSRYILSHMIGALFFSFASFGSWVFSMPFVFFQLFLNENLVEMKKAQKKKEKAMYFKNKSSEVAPQSLMCFTNLISQ